MDAPTAALLQEVVRRESLSLLSYVGDAFPWTAKGGDAALAELRRVVEGHRRAVAALGRLLVRHRVPPPFTGSYPSGFTTVNFLALSHILPRLVASERGSLTLTEAEAEQASDPEARAALSDFLAAKRDHLARLEALGAARTANPAAAVASPVAS